MIREHFSTTVKVFQDGYVQVFKGKMVKVSPKKLYANYAAKQIPI